MSSFLEENYQRDVNISIIFFKGTMKFIYVLTLVRRGSKGATGFEEGGSKGARKDIGEIGPQKMKFAFASDF